jgi:hypothetical protein
MTTKTANTPTTLADFNADLFNALAAIPTLKKDARNPHFKNYYLSLEGLIEGVKPILWAHNFVLLQPVTSEGAAVTVTTILRHISGEQLSSALTLTVSGEATSQALGSAITYARRYGAGGLLGLATSLDSTSEDDGHAASAAAPAPADIPRPDDYAAWLATLHAAAYDGWDALVVACNVGGHDAHRAILRPDLETWSVLKQIAEKCDAEVKKPRARVRAARHTS